VSAGRRFIHRSGRRSAVLRLALGLAAVLAPLLARAAVAADPFYLGLLRDGVAAYDRKDYAASAHALRLACFGLLEEPAPLGDCLVRLAAAQGAAGDNEGFQSTFGRLAEVEERFGIYRKLALPPDLRQAFEDRAAATIPPSTLAAVPTFAGLASRRAGAQWAALPPKERRRQLEARLAKEPRDPAANRLLAELDFDDGRTAEALARAEQAAALAPADPDALCLRGLTRAWARRCKDAVVDLGPCPRGTREPRYATALLGCWVELGEWREARGVADALAPEVKGERQVAALLARVQQHAPAAATAPVPGLAARAGPPGPASPVSATRPAPGAGPRQSAGFAPPSSAAALETPAALSAAERASLERVRSLLKSVQARDLKQAFDLARPVADAHPDVREAQLLAGETAYRNSRWREAASYLRRGGEPPNDRPELLFYLAVSLYESGDAPGAAAALRRSLPSLQRTPYVETYTRRILGPGNAG
jgi:tetratricopeptide (TPR) repeat protein